MFTECRPNVFPFLLHVHGTVFAFAFAGSPSVQSKRNHSCSSCKRCEPIGNQHHGSTAAPDATQRQVTAPHAACPR